MSDLKPLPYYKWFWQDFRASRSVQRMTYIERGLYRELLDECWVEGSIPDNMHELALICGCPDDVMATAWRTLSERFIRKGNAWVNLRLDCERTGNDKMRIQNKENGKKGGIAKLNKLSKMEATAKQPLGDRHIEEKRREEKSKEKRKPWELDLDDESASTTKTILSFWPKPPSKQPNDSPVPATRPALLAARLAELKGKGVDMSVCEAIARRFVDEYKKGGYMKAAQYFFGKDEDAPWVSYYRIELHNRRANAS